MANDRLKAALDRSRVTPAELALLTGNDIKTVGRWLSGRVPHPRTRFAVAKRLKEDEDFLWPGLRKAVADSSSTTSIVQVYPNRAAVPPNLWDWLLEKASREIGILVYVGMFLTEKPDLLAQLRSKAESGARVRIALGDYDCDAVKQRSADEGIGRDTISAKIRHAEAFFQPLLSAENVEIRHHQTVLYNSIYRFDDDMIVNPHVYGKTAPMAPALHLRRSLGDRMFDTYAESFEAVWDSGN